MKCALTANTVHYEHYLKFRVLSIQNVTNLEKN